MGWVLPPVFLEILMLVRLEWGGFKVLIRESSSNFIGEGIMLKPGPWKKTQERKRWHPKTPMFIFCPVAKDMFPAMHFWWRRPSWQPACRSSLWCFFTNFKCQACIFRLDQRWSTSYGYLLLSSSVQWQLPDLASKETLPRPWKAPQVAGPP